MLSTNNDIAIRELFSVPVNPTLVAILDSKLKLYSSKALINKYRHSLASSKESAASYKFLNNMINNQMLMPVYLNKGLLSMSWMKIFGGKNSMKGINGFYASDLNKIYILIDNNTKWGHVSDSWISRLTIHECMHMACSHGKDKFLKLYYNEYAHFYNVFFHLLADVKITRNTSDMIAKDIDIYMKTFHKFEAHRANLQKAIYHTGDQVFGNILKKLGFNQIDTVREGYKKLLVLFIKHEVAGIEQALKDPACKYILINLQKTYPSISSNNAQTLAIQELIFPSEIAAVFSELQVSSNKIPKAISMIKVK